MLKNTRKENTAEMKFSTINTAVRSAFHNPAHLEEKQIDQRTSCQLKTV